MENLFWRLSIILITEFRMEGLRVNSKLKMTPDECKHEMQQVEIHTYIHKIRVRLHNRPANITMLVIKQ